MDVNNVPVKYIKKYESVSCLHTIEHIGLGRYGDKINVNGHLNAIENIAKLVKKKNFYILVCLLVVIHKFILICTELCIPLKF